MKIALVILESDPKRGGAERYTVDLAAALGRRGHDAKIIDANFVGAKGITRAARYEDFLKRVGPHLFEELDSPLPPRPRFDVVHAMLPVWCDIYHPHAGVAAEAGQKWNAIFNQRRRAMARVESEMLATPNRKPPIVLGLSNYVNAHIRRFYPNLPEDRLVRLFNAVDLERFDPPAEKLMPIFGGNAGGQQREEVRALIIANDFERKGVPQAIKAVEMINDPRLKLDIAGRGKAASNHPSVHFCGEVADPRELYREADFFVLPTRHDPCSLVVLEALAMCLPVISTKFNGATEIMTDGVHGYVLDDPNDVNALADAMRKMLDPQRLSEMSAACRELRPRLSYEHHLDQLEGIYQRITAKTPASE